MMGRFSRPMAKASTNRPRKPLPADPSEEPACFVYLLGTSDGNGIRTYVGWTLDLDRRLEQHNCGKGARSTRGRSWILLHAERFATRGEAMSREWYLKRDRPFRKLLAQKIVR
jgi:putative endonuclease